MSYGDYKYYKPTFLDKLIIEGSGIIFLSLLFAGIWIDEFRWKLILTSLLFIVIAVGHHFVIEDRDKTEKNKLIENKLEKSIRKMKARSTNE